MLTRRGWWFLTLVLLMLGFARLGVKLPIVDSPQLVRAPNTALGVMAAALLFFFAFEWLLFVLRIRFVARRLKITRSLADDRGVMESLWVHRPTQVNVDVTAPAGIGFPVVRLTDRLPYGAEFDSGALVSEGSLHRDAPIEIRYRLRSTAIGRIRFEGLRLQMTDRHGFFYSVTFLNDAREYRVLPPLVDARGHVASVKRHNLLPPPGVHRLRRPGTGSELLDLRDYLPGDPPKTIAWKASARRDRLITKEFESEVPIRCTLFIDTSNSVRVGQPRQNALSQLIEIAASVVQAAASKRDHIGLCLFDAHQSELIRPARTARHMAQVINRMVDTAGLAPRSSEAHMNPLLPLAHSVAAEIYPEQLRPEINHVPWWMPWLWPQRSYTIRRPRWADRLNDWLPFLMLGYLIAIAMLLGFVGRELREYLAFPRRLYPEAGPVVLLIVVIIGLLFGLAVAVLRLPSYLFNENRKSFHRRKQLAAMLAVRYGLGPGGLALLLEDEELFVVQMQRFLGEHRVPYAAALAEGLDRGVFASTEKIQILAAALLSAVGQGHDNELFVLMVDLLAVPGAIDPLLRAVKVAVARHHRVIVLCPRPTETAPSDDKNRKPSANESPTDQVFQDVRRAFGQLGVPVVAAHGNEPTALVLERIDRLRMMGRKR